MKGKRLLVVDDEAELRAIVVTVAEDMGFEVAEAGNKASFERSYRQFAPSFIVLDLALPDGDGVELLRFLAAEKCGADIAVVSGFDAKVLRTARELGASQGLRMVGTLQKPIQIVDLEALLRRANGGAAELSVDELGYAIASGQLVVHYQPKARLPFNAVPDVEQCEALVRWQHPVHGLIPPGRFIPLAERAHLMDGLTCSVLLQVLAQMAAWSRIGLDLGVAINLPPELLTDLAFPDRVVDMAYDEGVPSTRLVFEVTESGVMEDPARAMDILARFRLKGIGLSMDDFGTGYSSLQQLLRMPFNELKIDQSFVKGADTDEEAALIVRASVDLAHNLGLKVCAEGVETETTLMFLSELGCDYAQGFHIGRPCPAEALTGQLMTWRGGTPQPRGNSSARRDDDSVTAIRR